MPALSYGGANLKAEMPIQKCKRLSQHMKIAQQHVSLRRKDNGSER